MNTPRFASPPHSNELFLFCSKGSSLLTLNYRGGAVAPIFLNTLNYQLSENIRAQIAFKCPLGFAMSSLATSLMYGRDSYYAEMKLNLSVRNTYLSLHLSKSFWEDSIKFKTQITHGYLGTTFSYAIEKQITRHTRVDSCIVLSSSAGVVLNFELVFHNFLYQGC